MESMGFFCIDSVEGRAFKEEAAVCVCVCITETRVENVLLLPGERQKVFEISSSEHRPRNVVLAQAAIDSAKPSEDSPHFASFFGFFFFSSSSSFFSFSLARCFVPFRATG